MDRYSPYRWEETTVTDLTLSGTGSGELGSNWLELRAPITEITELVIDDVSQTEDTDFEVRHAEGRVRVYSGLPWGNDNIVVSYKYGYTSSDDAYLESFGTIEFVESAIALLIKKNPLLLSTMSVEGINIKFSPIYDYLRLIPHLPDFVPLGPANITEPRE